MAPMEDLKDKRSFPMNDSDFESSVLTECEFFLLLTGGACMRYFLHLRWVVSKRTLRARSEQTSRFSILGSETDVCALVYYWLRSS